MASDSDRFEAQAYQHDNCDEYCGKTRMSMECTAVKPTLDDIQYLEDVTHMFGVDKEGTAIAESEHTDGDFVGYQCSLCKQLWDSWEAIKEHIGLEIS